MLVIVSSTWAWALPVVVYVVMYGQPQLDIVINILCT